MFIIADYHNEAHANSIIALLNEYAQDPMGGGTPLSEYVISNLIPALQNTPNAFTVLGFINDQPVAIANCFTALSTFASKPLINIHDLAVSPAARGQQMSQKLLNYIVEKGKSMGCCKVTLEVLSGNSVAKSAYEKFGFEQYRLNAEHGSAQFMQKIIA